MKKRTWLNGFFTLILLGLLLCGPLPVVRAQGTVIYLNPGTATLEPGGTVTVNIAIDGVSNLYGAEVHLTYDPAILEVVGAKINPGSMLYSDIVVQNRVDAATGKIDYAIAQKAPHTPFNGNGVLASVTFRAKAVGTSAVNFTAAALADNNAAPLSATTRNSTYTVSQPAYCSTLQGYHVVQAGETLYAIGRAYATRPAAIALCNGLVNPGKLPRGLKLSIPAAPWSPVPAGPIAKPQFTPGGATPTPTPTPTCQATYTVQRGDTLYAIARRYNITVWKLASANQIYDLNRIYPGQSLCIP